MSIPPRPTQREAWEADFAALSQQVAGLETDYRDLKLSFVSLDKKFDTGFAALSAKIEARNITPWATIISFGVFMLMSLSSVGYLARQPIVDNAIRFDAELLRNSEQRRAEDRRIAEKISAIQSQLDFMRGYTSAPRQ